MNLRESQPTGAFTVGDLTAHIKAILETEFDEVLVRGELSNYKQHSSGHRYFTLKDEHAQISCVMWKSRTLGFTPTDGMKVVIGGRVTVYMVRGNYQIDCVFMRPDGVGSLYMAFAKLKAKLEGLGWFDESRKRSLPRFPQRVGIATSSTGAALQDMLSTMQRRYTPLEVVLRPTLVQGEGSADDIARAIAELNTTDVDVIIVGRGGGSIEDLWSFNTEVVARAIYESSLPVISAVGHETDFTIADFVADKRAPTPTAAAEFVTPYLASDLLQLIDELESRMIASIESTTMEMHDLVHGFLQGTTLRRIQERVTSFTNNLEQQRIRQYTVLNKHLEMHLLSADHLLNRLKSLHPYRPLKLGYAIVERDQSPLPVTASLQSGETVWVMRWNERAEVTVNNILNVARGDRDGEEDRG